MMHSKIVASVLVATFAICFAWAQCRAAETECSARLGPFPYPDSAIQARDEFLAAVCGNANGNVYSISDPALKDRFRRIPGPPHPFHGNLYSESAKRQRLEGDAVFAVVVETDSTVKYVAVIQSTGHALLDELGIEWFKKQSMPAYELDGNPVRTLFYIPLKFRVTPAKL